MDDKTMRCEYCGRESKGETFAAREVELLDSIYGRRRGIRHYCTDCLEELSCGVCSAFNRDDVFAMYEWQGRRVCRACYRRALSDGSLPEGMMRSILAERLKLKCMRMYERKKKLAPVKRFIERVLRRDPALAAEIWDGVVRPDIRECHFPRYTPKRVQNEAREIFRNSRSFQEAVDAMADRIAEIPFTQDEIDKTLELIREMVAKERNPMTKIWAKWGK